MTRIHHQEAGFTLLEMLVGLALFSLLLGCFGGLFVKLEKTTAVISRVEGAENIDVVRRFLRTSLESSRAFARVAADGSRVVRFTGEPSRIVYMEVAAGEREVGGIYETELRLDPDGHLVIERRPSGWGAGLDVSPQVLLANVQSLAFAYLPCPSRAGSKLVHHWTEAGTLPFEVSVAVSFRKGAPGTWADVSAFLPAADCPAGW